MKPIPFEVMERTLKMIAVCVVAAFILSGYMFNKLKERTGQDLIEATLNRRY